MASTGSLRRRVIAAYVLSACAVCGCFATAAFFVLRAIEDRLIDQRLSRAADQLIDRHRQGLSTDLPLNVAMYRAPSIPPALSRLQPGLHEADIDGQSLHIVVRDVAGERVVFADNESDFENIEINAYLILGGSFLACLALAVLLGRATASLVIAPVTALAHAVQHGDGQSALPSLGSSDEIGVLARAFAARTDEQQKFLARERWFVGDVSHELRTPLTVVLGAAELLAAQLQDRKELLPAVERIRRTAAETTDRVGALLLLSRAPETVDAPRTALSPLIRQEMERCRLLLLDKPVVLRLDAPSDVHVFARPELAAMAIGNLIRNACQFTDSGHVEVSLRADKLVVEDTGVGVPAAIRERLFERFVRASADRSTGSGLGLAIVRRIADHLGWQVSMEDRAGGGSRFVVTLTLAS